MTGGEAGRSDIGAAKSYAMILLSRRAYTEKGLYEKLCTRYDEHLAAMAVARMLELGLLDDEDYARRHAADLSKLKGYAPRRVVQELLRKGIEPETAEAAAAELEDDPEPQIARLILKRHKDCLNDEKGRNKAVNSLLRKGYGYGDIAAVMRHLKDDETYYDDWE